MLVGVGPVLIAIFAGVLLGEGFPRALFAGCAVAFTTWAYALARTTAGKMGATIYLVPPLAVLMGWLILGEAP